MDLPYVHPDLGVSPHYVVLVARDANGTETRTSTLIRTYANDPIASISRETYGSSGDQITLTASVSGGKPPYTYRWSDPSEVFTYSPNAEAASVMITLPYVPPDDGVSQRYVVLVAKDANGIEAQASRLVTTNAQ